MNTPPYPRRASRPKQAFTLIELLLVTALILILAGLAIPAFKGMSGGASLTRASEEIAALISLARQRASTFNRQVAIRFYEGGGGFSSHQIWEKPEASSDPSAPASWRPVGPEVSMPLGTLIKKSAAFSPLLEKFPNNTESKPRGTVRYSEVLFTPSGSMVAASSEAHLTIVPTPAPPGAGVVPGLPSNFATIVIEPFNSRPAIYRP